MRTATSVTTGAVLPLLLGASLGSLTTDAGDGTWAYPMPSVAFLLLSLGLALSHLLVLLGYVEVRRRVGAVARPAAVAALGTAGLVGCEIWSGLEARTDLDAGVLTALDTCYAVASVLVLVGTLGAGLLLRATGSALAAPLLLNGALLLLAVPVRLLASDGWGIAALTVWSLSYLWLGLRLRRAGDDPEALGRRQLSGSR
ncbi:hypothetical protein G5V58_11970 [Nocardioides anomalus]|uniref:DUF4386 family protein n=1 Tax=Nocardioides anomalus TaxID=2712223 RepID=A0A6G6WE09_9ACTN|nr:hypothetical protein [Nocardioides anomalus]QIG43387.1 hypothetical protein G5V58_11970 [Nocardioides anomalus]